MKRVAVLLLLVFAIFVADAPSYAQAMSDDDSNLLKKSEAGDADALETVTKRAKKGDAVAQFFLGVMYESGKGEPKSYPEALKWLQQAAEQGHLMAQNNLGAMYSNGRGVAQNDVEAEKWFRMAAMQGSAMAQNNLGLLYANGRSLNSDLSREVKHGVVSEFKPSVPQNDAEAVKWYFLAAEQGYVPAQFNLGVMFGSGRGVLKDDTAAVKWYRRAAENGDAGSQFNLGARYANGRGVEQNNIEACKWWVIAKAGTQPGSSVFESAVRNLDVLSHKMEPAEFEIAQKSANDWLALHPKRVETNQ